MFKFITLSNGKIVQALYEADEDQVAKITGSKYDFKELTDGNTTQKIAFVDADGNKVDIFKIPAILKDGNTVKWFDYLENVTKDIGDLVSEWDNKTGINGIIPGSLLQADPDKQPTWTLNDGVLFDGIDDFMKTDPFTFAQPEQIYIVFKQITHNDQDRIFDGNSNFTGLLRQLGASPGIMVYGGASSPNNLNLAVGSFGIVTVLFNGASSSLQVNNTPELTGDFGSLDMGGFLVGGEFAFANIQVKEIILRKIADTSQNKQDIKDYLATKYSI